MRRIFRSLALAIVAVTLTSCGYNNLQDLRNQVEKGQSDVLTQLQRRADLIPNLVATVQGITKQESSVFGELAEARAKLAGSVQSGSLEEAAAANQAMQQPLMRFLALTENYPELKSSENFRALQDQLEGTENRIAVARQDYNALVQKYNSAISRFPSNITAKVFGLGTPKPYFELDSPEARVAPKVKFQ